MLEYAWHKEIVSFIRFKGRLVMTVHRAGAIEEKEEEYRKKGVSKIKLGLTDIDGVIRGKYIGTDKFFTLFEGQGGFCDCVFGWDVNDQLYERQGYTGWQSGFPDTGFRLLTDSEVWVPGENCPYFIGEFAALDGGDHPLCPRTKLRKVIERYAEIGLSVKAGLEYEFFVFREDPISVREKNYFDLMPLTAGNFGYSILRASAESELFSGLMDYARDIGCELEGLHCETGPGVWEAALSASHGAGSCGQGRLVQDFQ